MKDGGKRACRPKNEHQKFGGVLFLSVFAACFAYTLILIRFSVFVTDSTAVSLFPLPDIKAIHTP